MRKRSEKHSFKENLERHKRALRDKLATITDAVERKTLTERIRDIDSAIHMDGWLRSTELRPPV